MGVTNASTGQNHLDSSVNCRQCRGETIYNQIFQSPIPVLEIQNILRDFARDKAPRYDGFVYKMCKLVFLTAGLGIVNLCNRVMICGEVPGA